MAKMVCAKLIYLICLSGLLTDVCWSYAEYGMNDKKICHPLSRKRKLRLEDTEDSAVVVKPDHMFDSWNVIADMKCVFVLKTNHGDGLFAVIQMISFRRNESTNQCIDYVEFEREDGYSVKFCGQMNRMKSKYYPVPEADGSIEVTNPTVTYSEFDVKGEITTTIFVSKQRLLPGESLDLTIVYTPFKDCKKVKDPDAYIPAGHNSCIWKEYFCDEYRNCAYETCPDEMGCKIVGNGTGTKVTVGAVTTIFLCFILFLMCLWTCRRHKKLCWSSDCAGPNLSGAGPLPMDHRTVDPTDRPMVPTAPMLEEVVPTPVQDKDLPPSYDSLFPHQANSTAT